MSNGAPAPGRPGTAGAAGRAFTVLEMIVTMTLTVICLALASRLLLDAQASIAHSGRRLLDIPVEQSLDRLRADVRASIGFYIPVGMTGEWLRDEPLRLLDHLSGDAVVYELSDGRWQRLVYRPGESQPVRHLLLERVTTFRWRSVPGTPRPSLEVELRYEETGPLTGRVAAGQLEAATARRTVGLVVAPRVMDLDEPSIWW